MEPREPLRKRPRRSNRESLPFPVTEKKLKGYFDGFSVVVDDPESAKILWVDGCYGKSNLSRSFPNFNSRDTATILRRRQFDNRKKFFTAEEKPNKVIVVPDSDTEEDYFTNLNVTYEIDRSDFKETLHLSLAESYFLLNDIECLEITNEDAALTGESAWDLFNEVDEYFTVNYAVYLHFRAKNWVVKQGLKFGGDYLLYKQGSSFYHASYVVLIDVVDENLRRIESKQRRSMDYTHLIGLNRLCESAGKDLLIVQLIWKEIESSSEISQLSINELLLQRWVNDAT